MIYRFDTFTLDADRFRLTGADDKPLPLQTRALELLLLLVENAGGVVSKEAINREVWGGLYTSRKALPFQVKALREALGDGEKPYRFIETIYGKGLRFIADVETEQRVVVPRMPTSAEDFADEGECIGLPTSQVGDQPTIAVLPFVEERGADDLAGLATALPVDIITALSHFQLLRVTARASSFMLDDPGLTPLTIKSRLGCDYCLSGRVSRSGDKYSVFVELLDTSSQAIVWAEQFEIEPRDVHSLRAEIVSRTVSRVETRISQHEAKKLPFSQPDSLTAWQSYHIGTSLIYRRGTENLKRAQTYLERAVAIDPNFSRAWAGLAQTHSFELINRPFDAQKAAKKSLMKFAEQAVEANEDDPSANLWLGRALGMTDAAGDPLVWLERSLELAPSYALAHQHLAATHTELGNHDKAKDHATASLLLNPHGPERFANYTMISLAFFKTGHFTPAIEWSKKAANVPYDHLHILLSPLVTYHLTGDAKSASRIAQRIKTAFPGITQRDIFNLDTLARGGFKKFAADALAVNGIV